MVADGDVGIESSVKHWRLLLEQGHQLGVRFYGQGPTVVAASCPILGKCWRLVEVLVLFGVLGLLLGLLLSLLLVALRSVLLGLLGLLLCLLRNVRCRTRLQIALIPTLLGRVSSAEWAVTSAEGAVTSAVGSLKPLGDASGKTTTAAGVSLLSLLG